MNIFLRLIFCFLISISSVYGQHYKKNGQPDRRYKENKIPGVSKSYSNRSYGAVSYSENRKSNKAYSSVPRDKHGRIKRSASAKKAFMRETGYPKGRKGWIVDHIIPLKKGGCDCPANMQWQTKEAAKEKDKWE